MPCAMCAPARGHSEATKALPLSRAFRATGLPSSSATSKLSFITPHEPPWPEQRSITSMSAPGMSSSISRAFCPMFCARA